jgi:hypothetical protein
MYNSTIMPFILLNTNPVYIPNPQTNAVILLIAIAAGYAAVTFLVSYLYAKTPGTELEVGSILDYIPTPGFG